MADLFWPGDERAGELFSETALLAAMTRVETAWLGALSGAGIAPPGAAVDLSGLVGPADLAPIAQTAEAGGSPVVPLLTLLRERVREPATALWLHRGLTSQDVMDTALMLCAADCHQRLTAEIDLQAGTLGRLADTHRRTVMAGRTLTQHAVPITFGLKAAQWLNGLLDAGGQLADIPAPAQFGGAAGTLAATVELARRGGAADPPAAALGVAAAAAASLGLADPGRPWHTGRATITRLGDALVTVTDCWGRIANDVLLLARPEIAELAEPPGRGGSSTMPDKANPVLSVLIRRAALAAPALGAQLHLAAAEAIDERPDGAWHLEWATLATLARRAVVAAGQATELLAGLRVDTVRMAATAAAATPQLLAELHTTTARPPGEDLTAYLGATDRLIDATLERAARMRS